VLVRLNSLFRFASSLCLCSASHDHPMDPAEQVSEGGRTQRRSRLQTSRSMDDRLWICKCGKRYVKERRGNIERHLQNCPAAHISTRRSASVPLPNPSPSPSTSSSSTLFSATAPPFPDGFVGASLSGTPSPTSSISSPSSGLNSPVGLPELLPMQQQQLPLPPFLPFPVPAQHQPFGPGVAAAPAHLPRMQPMAAAAAPSPAAAAATAAALSLVVNPATVPPQLIEAIKSPDLVNSRQEMCIITIEEKQARKLHGRRG